MNKRLRQDSKLDAPVFLQALYAVAQLGSKVFASALCSASVLQALACVRQSHYLPVDIVRIRKRGSSDSRETELGSRGHEPARSVIPAANSGVQPSLDKLILTIGREMRLGEPQVKCKLATSLDALK